MLEVNSVGSRNNDEIDLSVLEYVLEVCDNFDAREEVPSVRLLGSGFPLENGVESVELGEGQDEGDVEDAERKEGNEVSLSFLLLSLSTEREKVYSQSTHPHSNDRDSDW